MSIRTFDQVKTIHKPCFTVEIRFDDECRNGHNTFSITGTTNDSCGCIHEEIVKSFPELARYIKWHLVSTDGPMHYTENTLYLAKRGDLESARKTAVWPDATIEELSNEELLKKRLPVLLGLFRFDMELLGFTW